MARPDLTYGAPVAFFDLYVDDNLGDVWPCDECLPWHVEVIREDGHIYLREWHAAECPTLTHVLASIRRSDGG